jgi:putative endonuclease
MAIYRTVFLNQIPFILRQAQDERSGGETVHELPTTVELLATVRPELVEGRNSRGNMSFWVYILHCADGSYYTGHTDNLDQRISQHAAGGCGGYTAKRLPVSLVFSQECVTREEALGAEQQIKGWSRAKKEAMMRGDWQEVSRLARGSTGSPRTE